MSRLHLGDRGEEQARHLLDTFALTRGFRVAVVTSPDVRALDEMRRRLALVADAVYHWSPDERIFERLEEVDRKQATIVYWLQGLDEDAWRGPLQRLNFARENLKRDHPGLWVYAGPPALGRWMARNAADTLSVASTEITLDRRPAFLPDEPLRPLRWIHLSDLHFEGDQKWQRRASMKALIRHAVEEKEDGRAPDFLFCTGDVANRGRPEEFDQARRFFDELVAKLEIDAAEQLFIVPGNHDVDRGAIGPSAILADHLQSVEQVDQVLRHAPSMDLLGERLQAFYDFTAGVQGRARGLRKVRPWRVDRRKVAGVSVAIAQLNSAWVSGPEDERLQLLVGQKQLRDALDASEDAFLRIALVHHPLEDLRDFDQAAAETVLGSPGGVHFLLYGHRHRSRTFAIHSPDGLLMRLAAPAGQTSGQWPRGYLSAELDLEAGEASIRFFRYSHEGRGFWTLDTGAYEGAKDGVWRFGLPPGLTLAGEAVAEESANAAGLSHARRTSLVARYRGAAASVHGSVRFLGFGSERSPGRRRQVEVPELYVPLRVGRRGGDEESLSTAELLDTLAPGDEPASRIAILGGPGSGKTTLTRFLTVALAGETELPAPGELLPLFLPFRELVRGHASPRDWPPFEEYLRDEAKRRLQVPLPERLLEDALEAGRAVLLLDGLDEVGSEKHRRDACDRVTAFCRSYPKTPVLITSRIAGYERSALSEDGKTAFRHFQLLPFDDGELDDFIERWYGLQEPTGSDARERGIAKLNAALAARPRVKELARNPMLATLIAMVHRFEARLPGERAELYRLCIKTLLETWPEERGQALREVDPGRQCAPGLRQAIEDGMNDTQRLRVAEALAELILPTD